MKREKVLHLTKPGDTWHGFLVVASPEDAAFTAALDYLDQHPIIPGVSVPDSEKALRQAHLGLVLAYLDRAESVRPSGRSFPESDAQALVAIAVR